MLRERTSRTRGNVDIRERVRFNGTFLKEIRGTHFNAYVEGLVLYKIERKKVGQELKAGEFVEVFV